MNVTIPAEDICIASVALAEPTSPSSATTRLPLRVAAVNVPAVIEILPVASLVAVVVPTVNSSALSSNIKIALLPVEPRSMIIPISFALEVAPVFNSNNVSETFIFVVLTVVVVPLTVKSPVTTKF